METPEKNTPDTKKEPWMENARELSLLDLNNIKLDVRHTILTPEYLEKQGKGQ